MNTKDEIFTRFKNELPLNFFGLHEEEKDQIFEWFWKHLEQRETESYENGYQDAKDGLFVSDLQAKIQSLEQLLKAADEVIDEVRLAQMPPTQAVKIVKLLYKYDSKKETATALKQQSAPNQRGTQ